MQTIAEKLGGELVQIDSQAEQEFIYTNLIQGEINLTDRKNINNSFYRVSYITYISLVVKNWSI